MQVSAIIAPLINLSGAALPLRMITSAINSNIIGISTFLGKYQGDIHCGQTVSTDPALLLLKLPAGTRES